MNRLRSWWKLAGVLLLVSGVVGCHEPKPMEYSDALAEYNLKIAQAAYAFRLTVLPLRSGQPADSTAVHRAYDTLRQTVTDVRSEYRALGVPGKRSADDLDEAYRKFLDDQDQAVNQEFGQIVQTVDRNDLNAGDKWKVIDGLFNQVAATEKADLEALKKAEDPFLTESKLRVPLAAPTMMPMIPPGGMAPNSGK